MRKILLISHSSSGGGAEVIFKEVIDTLLEKEEYELYIIIPGEGILLEKIRKTNKVKKIFNIKNRLIRENDGRFKFIKRCIIDNIRSILMIIKICKKYKIDLIYSSTILNIIGIISSKILKIKHIWHIHELFNDDIRYINKKNEFFIRRLMKSSKLIFISKDMKIKWESRLKEKFNGDIIYNPIKKMRIQPLKLNKKLRIGFIGAYIPRKNIHLLLDVFNILKDKYLNVELVLCGENIKTGVEEYCKNRNYAVEKIKTYNYLEADRFYKMIDVVVLPSLAESWGLVVLEAILQKKITVTTNQTSLNEILVDKKNTFFFNPHSKKELFKILEYIYLNREIVEREMIKENCVLLGEKGLNEKFRNNIWKVFESNKKDEL